MHEPTEHVHGRGCGHPAIVHDGHVDFVEDGRLDHPHGDHVDEHVLAIDTRNPDDCSDGHPCGAHAADHVHGAACGHPAVPHGGHVDYLVDGHLHHQHDGHCDDHGAVVVA